MSAYVIASTWNILSSPLLGQIVIILYNPTKKLGFACASSELVWPSLQQVSVCLQD